MFVTDKDDPILGFTDLISSITLEDETSVMDVF